MNSYVLHQVLIHLCAEDRPGIIALFNDGETTDANWKCSRRALTNWNTRDYDDSTWDNALALG